MSADAVVVVGAGIAGLAAAATLAVESDVTVVDRLPAAGGVLGYEHPLVVSLAREAAARGVRELLGTTAVRSVDGRLLVAGPGGVRWLPAARIVYAGGSRPSTAAELGLFGGRFAGVLPATVAIHLMEAGVRIGHRAIVVGSGDWADAALGHLRSSGCGITVVDPSGDAIGRAGEPLWRAWEPRSVAGRGRVAELTIGRRAAEVRLACDVVVLAAGTRPNRNVDGALADDDAGVSFVQSAGDRLTAADVVAAARTAATNLAHQLSPGLRGVR